MDTSVHCILKQDQIKEIRSEILLPKSKIDQQTIFLG